MIEIKRPMLEKNTATTVAITANDGNDSNNSDRDMMAILMLLETTTA